MKNITLGSDPEFGVINFKGTPKSVVGLLGGTKEKPLALGNKCFRQEDNVGAELTIPPSSDPLELLESIKYGRSKMDEILSEVGLRTIAASSLEYDPLELNTPQAQTFGCDPSFDVYMRDISERPSAKDVGNIRSFGFHVHIGWKGPKNMADIESIVKMMDLYIGLPSLFLDTDTRRRGIYGNPGDFRFTDYGLEYRTLGGNLLQSDESILFVFNRTLNVIEDYVNNGYKYEEIELQVREAITSNNLELAIQLINHTNIESNGYTNSVWNFEKIRQTQKVL